MNMTGYFNYPAYFVSAAAYFLLGFVWYSNILFAKAWQKETGVKMSGSKSMPIIPMIGQLISTLLFTLGVYMVVMLGKFSDIKGACIASLSIIAFFILPINSGNLFFTNKKLLFLIDAGYQAVGAIIMTFILVFWK
jgi:hypothetical protein